MASSITMFLLVVLCTVGLLPAEIPDCEYVAVSYLGDSGRSCLHVSADEPSLDEFKKNRAVQCFDTPNWFDGTNGCAQYGRNSGWCERFGYNAYDTGRAIDNCCACGGGLTLKFFHDDDVEAMVDGDWKNGRVVEVMPGQGGKSQGGKGDGKGIAFYTVLLDNGARVRVSQMHQIREAPLLRKLELKRCQGRAAQVWRLWRPPQMDSSASPVEEHWIEFENPTTGQFLGMSPRLEANPSLQWAPSNEAVARDAPETPRLKLVSGSDRFANVWLLSSGLNLCLVGGRFAEPQLSRPQWVPCNNAIWWHTPLQRWQLRCVAGNESDGDGDLILEHVEWLRQESAHPRGVDVLDRLPPWILLNVERDSSTAVVKEQFRALSRVLHPDKQRSKEGRESAERLFPLLQKAHSALKAGETAEAFRRDSEVDQLLYARSKYVIDLDVDGLRNVTEHYEQELAEDAVVWVIVFYSAMCGMSRLVVPVVELAAESLESFGVRFGAFGCGLHGTARQDAKDKGHKGAIEDPLCQRWGEITETPTFHAVGPSKFSLPFGYPHVERLGERLLEFGHKARRLIDKKIFIPSINASTLESDGFAERRSVLLFVGNTSGSLGRELLAYAPSVVTRLAHVGIDMGVVYCSSGPNSSFKSDVNCSAEGVTWYPDVRLYGPGRGHGRGVSLVGEPFVEARDFEIALQAMANMALVDLGSSDAPVEVLDDERVPKNTDSQSQDAGGSCSGEQSPPSAEDHTSPALQVPPRAELPAGHPAKNNAAGGQRDPRLGSGGAADAPRLTQRRNAKQRSGGRVYSGGGGSGRGGLLAR